MASRANITEMAERIIAGGNLSQDLEIDVRELVLYANMSRDFMVKRNYMLQRREGLTDVSGDFIVAFDNVAVQKDTKKKLFYSVLPSPVIELPRDMGVYMISLMEDQTSPFVPLNNGFLGLSRDMFSAVLEGRYGYFREKDRVYYTGGFMSNCCSGDITPPDILMKLIPSSSWFEDDDMFFCPPDMQDELLKNIIQMYTIEQDRPKDTVNDTQKK